jgi:anaerobic ribonucleoside-triphosphate reductase
MVIKNYLLATDAGLGHGETPIFPISIFKVKEKLITLKKIQIMIYSD